MKIKNKTLVKKELINSGTGLPLLISLIFFFRIIVLVFYSVFEIAVKALMDSYNTAVNFINELFNGSLWEKYLNYKHRHRYKAVKDGTTVIKKQPSENRISKFFTKKEAELVFGSRINFHRKKKGHFYPYVHRDFPDGIKRKDGQGRQRIPGALKISMLWLKKKAERPHRQKFYSRAVSLLIEKNRIPVNIIKKAYARYIELILRRKKGNISEKDTEAIVNYYRNPDEKNFKKMCRYFIDSTAEKKELLLGLIKSLDSKFSALIKKEISAKG